MKRLFIRRAAAWHPLVLAAALMAGGAGCSAKYVYYSSAKDSAAQKQDAYACESEAAKYGSEVGKPGKRSVIDAKTRECMEARGYKSVKEGAQLDKLGREAESALLSSKCAERCSAVQKALEMSDENAAKLKEGCQGFADSYAGSPLADKRSKNKCIADCYKSWQVCVKQNGNWAWQIACGIGYSVCENDCK